MKHLNKKKQSTASNADNEVIRVNVENLEPADEHQQPEAEDVESDLIRKRRLNRFESS
jgi:hypothetical protein